MSDGTPTRVQYAAALRLARFAVKRSRPITSCPYDPTGDDRQRLLALVFVHEYLRLRPPTNVDYDEAEGSEDADEVNDADQPDGTDHADEGNG